MWILHDISAVVTLTVSLVCDSFSASQAFAVQYFAFSAISISLVSLLVSKWASFSVCCVKCFDIVPIFPIVLGLDCWLSTLSKCMLLLWIVGWLLLCAAWSHLIIGLALRRYTIHVSHENHHQLIKVFLGSLLSNTWNSIHMPCTRILKLAQSHSKGFPSFVILESLQRRNDLPATVVLVWCPSNYSCPWGMNEEKV